MKNYFVATLLFCFALSFQSCLKDECTTTSNYFRYDPVYMTESELRAEIQLHEARDLVNPGKMYFYNNLLFINEKFEGIHVYDNSNTSNPINLGFVRIPGNLDIVIKDDKLYADALVDLLAIDISDISAPSLISRVDEAFEVDEHPTNGYVVYYEKTGVEEKYDCQGGWFFTDDAIFASGETAGGAVLPNGAAGGTGVGGSTARISLSQDHLYLIDKRNLSAYDLSNATTPALLNKQNVGWDIETLFPYEDKLFIGSSSGMFIFDNSDPSAPMLLSEFQHARACDPVVVQGDRAYVTLRDGSECLGFVNQLDVIDISEVTAPELIKTYPMSNPHGLSVRNNVLYLCEGLEGVKIFDVTDDQSIDENLLHHETGFSAYDVISLTDELLFVIGGDGFYQYDISDKTAPVELSHIPVVREN